MTNKVTTEDRGAVRILRINRPERRNPVDGETAVGLGAAIEAFAVDDRVRVLVVTGEGELSFCAGADLRNASTLFGHAYVDKAGPMGFARLDPGKPTMQPSTATASPEASSSPPGATCASAPPTPSSVACPAAGASRTPTEARSASHASWEPETRCTC